MESGFVVFPCHFHGMVGRALHPLSLTQNLPCAIIISAEIEETYPLVKTGQNHT